MTGASDDRQGSVDQGPGRDDWVDWVLLLGIVLSLVGVVNGLIAIRERASVGLAWTLVSGVLLVLVLLAYRIARAVEGDR